MIRIKSKQAGFRRAGMAHPADWTEYPDRKFTAAQLAALAAEPRLIVEIIEKAVTELLPAKPLGRANRGKA